MIATITVKQLSTGIRRTVTKDFHMEDLNSLYNKWTNNVIENGYTITNLMSGDERIEQKIFENN